MNADDSQVQSETGEASIDERILTLERSVDDLRDQLLRRTADLDNMRRRHQQEREQLIFEANRRLITELLSTVDDLERTLEHAGEKESPMRQGVEMVYNNFLKILERYGVKPMESVGKEFDPHQHDAMMEEPRTDVAPGMVTREIQKGYVLNDSVLRHAKVFVSKEA
jgi:molecular chaperone GrpE